MPYDDLMAKTHTEWALKEWNKMPRKARAMLVPCLRAAASGFPAVQSAWLRFVSQPPRLSNWEANELSSVIRYLTKNLTDAERDALVAEFPAIGVLPCGHTDFVRVVLVSGLVLSNFAGQFDWREVVYWETAPSTALGVVA